MVIIRLCYVDFFPVIVMQGYFLDAILSFLYWKQNGRKQRNVSFCFFILYLDFNVVSAGLYIKADRRLIFDGFFVFLKLIKSLDTFSHIVIKM